jgi:hypothetical protein
MCPSPFNQCCAYGISNFKPSCDTSEAPCKITSQAAAASGIQRSTVVGIWQGTNVNYWSKCGQMNAYVMGSLMYQDVRYLSWPYLKSYLDQGIQVTLVLEFWDPAWNLLWNLSGGSRDNELRQFFQQVAADGRPVAVRILHEFNGNWYPWCIYMNGSNGSVQAFKQAFWHISGLIKSIAGNVKVQQAYNSMNVGGGDSLQSMFVGDGSTDEITVSAYNFCGPHNNQIQYIDQIINDWYNAMAGISGKPLGISEMSTTGQCGINKEAWILDTFNKLAYNYPRIKSVMWFLENKGNEDLDLNSYSQQQAFRQGWINFKTAAGWNADEGVPPSPTTDDIQSLSDADTTYQTELKQMGLDTVVTIKDQPVDDTTKEPLNFNIAP